MRQQRGIASLVLIGVIVIAVSIVSAFFLVYNDTTTDNDSAVVTQADLNRNSRDIVRKNQLSSLAADLVESSISSRISEPSDFPESIIPIDRTTEEPYRIITETPSSGEIQYSKGASCNEDNSLNDGGDSRFYAVRILLENGNFYCVDV